MSMPQVLLSIRQHRHTRCKLVRVGVWGRAGAGAPGGDASAAGRSLARQRLGLSQYQQLLQTFFVLQKQKNVVQFYEKELQIWPST